jgi:hypothetical protein
MAYTEVFLKKLDELCVELVSPPPHKFVSLLHCYPLQETKRQDFGVACSDITFAKFREYRSNFQTLERQRIHRQIVQTA